MAVSEAAREALLEAIAAELDRLMIEERLTQEDVMRRTGVHLNTVSRILRARNSQVGTVADVFNSLGYRVRVTVERTTSCSRSLC